MKQKSIDLLPVIEEIANIGWYETDIANGTWIGSDNFIAIFGLQKKDQYRVQEFQALVHPDDFDWVMAYFSECLSKQMDFNCEYRCVTMNGQTIYVNSRSKVYYNPDGTPNRVLGIKQDITKSKLNEHRVNQLNENNIRKNEVLSLVAHDLQSPLTQLEGLAKLLKQELPEKYHELISLQERICKTTQGMVREIMEIAELDDEAYRLKTAPTDVNNLIDQVVALHRLKANEKSITIHTKSDGECLAELNVSQFSRVINNLLSNAVKFTSEKRSIEVSTQSHPEHITIKVVDEGVGISAEDIPKLFKKFSKTARRVGTNGERSTGLGLHIVKKICDLHNATITVDSRENVGTTFTLTFPALPSASLLKSSI